MLTPSIPVSSRPRLVRFVAVLGLLAAVGSASAQTYTWNWVTGTGSNVTDPGWDATPPNLGSPSTALVLNYAGGLPGNTTYTLTNNLGNPQFDLNALTFNTLSSATTGGFTFAGAAGHTLRFNGADAVINQDGLGLVTLSSAITLNTGAVVRIGSTNPAFGLGNITLSGVISGAGGLVIGNGASGNAPTYNTRVVSLTGANTFTGGVTLDGGNLSIGGSNALGASGTFTVTANGGILNGSANGLGVTNWVLNGALRMNASLQLNSNTVVSGSGDMSVRDSFTVQSASAAYTGTVTIDRKVEPQRWPLPYDYAGTLTLSGSGGALTGVNTFNVFAGGSFVLSSNDAGSTPNANRIADTATINMSGAYLTLAGAGNGTALTERFGPLTGAGYSTVTAGVGTTAGATVLHAAALVRDDRGTFLFRGSNLGLAGSTGAITFTTAPTGDLVGGGGAAGTTTTSILPYAVGDFSTSTFGTALVTLDAAANGGVAGTTGVRPLAAAEYASNLTGGATTNVQLFSTLANAGTATINALVLRSSSVTGAGTLNITSGVILSAGGNAPQISNNVTFGVAEGQIFTTSSLTIGGNLTGSNGLTKSGDSALTLTGNNTGLTGRLTVNGGRVTFNSLNALPGTGSIGAKGTGTFLRSQQDFGTMLQYTGGTPATLDRAVAVDTGLLTLDSTNPAAPLTLSGVISGAGGLRLGSTSASVVALTGANTYTGPTLIHEGVLVISSDASLGAGGGLDLFTDTQDYDSRREGIRLAGNWTTSRHINFSHGSFVDTQGHTAVWNGPVTGAWFSRLIKAGTGPLQLNTASPYPGGVTLIADGGELRLAQNGALLSTSYWMNAGTTLHLDNGTLPAGSGSGTVTTERVNNAAVIDLMSATLRLTGNGTQGTTERVGDVIVTGVGVGGVIEVLSSGGQTNSLVVNNLSTAAGGVLVRGTGLGGTGGSRGRLFLSQINGMAVSNGLFLGGVSVEDLNALGVVDPAVYDTAVGVRRVNPATDFTTGPAIQNAAPTNLPATANFRVNPAVANPVPVLDAANTIGSLRFAPNGMVDYPGATAGTLTVTSGVIATEAGGAASITNTGSGRLTITAGAAPLYITANGNLTVAAALGGSGGISKSGPGTLTLNAASTNTGPLTVNAGAVALGANLTMGGLNGVAGTAIDLGTNTLTVNGAGSSYAGVISGSGLLSVATSLTLTGNNTFSGGVVSANATFSIGHPNAFGTGPVTFNGTNGFISFNTGTATLGNDITLSAPTSTAVFHFSLPSGTDQTVTLAGLIRGGSSPSFFRLSPTSSNGFVLANPNNTFTGTIDVSSGFLAVGSNSALGNPANPVFLAGGDLRFDADFTGGNVLARRLQISGGSRTLNTNGHTVEVSGPLTGSGNLVKVGAGTLILSGTANTYNGYVTVNAGTVLVNAPLPGATSLQLVTVNAGGTLGGTGAVGVPGSVRAVTVAAGGTLAPGGTAIGTLSVNGSTTFTAAAPGTGAVFAVRAARSGVNAIGANDRLAYSGPMNFAGLAAGTPAAGDNKFRITIISDGANPLVNGETYTMTVASLVSGGTGQIQRNGVRVNATTYTFDANDYQLASPSFSAFNGVSLVANTNGTLVLTFTPVPEPAGVLAVCGLITAGGWLVRRRRRGR